MTHNKTPEADLEGKRGLFFQIGLSIALAAALIVINIETRKPAMEDATVRILGLEVTPLGKYGQDTASAIKPPEARSTFLEKKMD